MHCKKFSSVSQVAKIKQVKIKSQKFSEVKITHLHYLIIFIIFDRKIVFLLPYFPFIRRILLKSAYSLLSACHVVVIKARS